MPTVSWNWIFKCYCKASNGVQGVDVIDEWYKLQDGEVQRVGSIGYLDISVLLGKSLRFSSGITKKGTRIQSMLAEQLK